MVRTERMNPADQSRLGAAERDIELAIIALKKGAYLLKYGRRGKPKFCPFRLDKDETSVLWISGKREKYLKLSQVSRIVSGQHTPVFQRYPRPEREYQSFSLIYNDRSLDLICKDKNEAEVWFTGLKALISQGHHWKGKTEQRSGGISSGSSSPRARTQRSSPLISPFDCSDSLQKDGMDPLHHHTPNGSPPKFRSEKELLNRILYPLPPKVILPSESACGSGPSLSSGGSNRPNGCMKDISVDAVRVSLSSAVSSSSHGSCHDDGEALGDVYIWGEGTGDGILGGRSHRVEKDSGNKMDSFVPKQLESSVVLDVQSIACGGRHAAVVTKQGEVFTWGEESGGRLGHGRDSDVLHPKLVDALKNMNIELIVCGEYYSCAVTLSGDLYTWGGSTLTFGLFEHRNTAHSWVPKRLIGSLEGLHVSSISCGPWHTAIVTSAGQLFTFGDGTFGVLGHGDRRSVSTPREVESLKGLRTVRAACGVWHTAAVVEIVVRSSSSSNCSSGKLFTWGDGDKGCLGHGDKEARIIPTCVAALVEPNFCQVACGYSLTVALTTTGHVYTMGSPVYGQLGDPQADGCLPTRIGGMLMKSYVEEIACGAYHVAVLTSRTEVYTWGKGGNGQLGHGDTDDRNSPSIVGALKDKQVKSIACGTNFTAAICLHKWISGIDQLMCSRCHLPFNFKRKRHNCYNCGLVYCNSCSSKKSLRTSLAPNPNKPYRVCDNCFSNLRKGTETDSSFHSYLSRRGSMNDELNEVTEEAEMLDSESLVQLGSSIQSFKEVETGSFKRNKRHEVYSSCVSPLPNGVSKWDARRSSKSINPMFGSSKKFFSASLPGSRIVSRATSPSKAVSSTIQPCETTLTPTIVGITSRMMVVEEVKRTNDILSHEVFELRAQVGHLTCKAQLQEIELERTTKMLKEAMGMAGEETTKCKAAKEVIKSLTVQLKDMAARLHVGASRYSKSLPYGNFSSNPPCGILTAATEQMSSPMICHEPDSKEFNVLPCNGSSCYDTLSQPAVKLSEATTKHNSRSAETDPSNGTEWIEQDEPGVYVTLVSLPGGLKDVRRVRFSRKQFSEKEAEQWWAANRARVYQHHKVATVDKSSVVIPREGLAH